MESLTLNSCLNQSKTLNSSIKADIRVVKQVGFPHFWRKREKISTFSLKIQSISTDAGFTAPSKNGLLLILLLMFKGKRVTPPVRSTAPRPRAHQAHHPPPPTLVRSQQATNYCP
ncbi:hypothetical protein RND81_01G197200 [Saponaria officinalis]|uniref:Uncharacterized protein n=1 Tax=Saponaria officinalis TaxID=3572 RepID=A0AAW1N8Q6_SAPOF